MPSRKVDESSLVRALLEEELGHADSKHRFQPSGLSESPPIILPSTFTALTRKPSVRTMSLHSEDTQDTAPTNASIAPLQDITSVQGKQNYRPLQYDDPRSFDLVEPGIVQERTYSLEARVELLLSKQHLKAIFADAKLFLKFTTFLSKYRPNSIPLLIYYLDTTKALKAIAYSNAILDGLETVSFADFTKTAPKISTNMSLQEKADQAFTILTQEDLPAYITHVFVDIISTSIRRKITGTMAPQLREASEGLAEVFCMSDMSKPDNPIVFSSEEFHRTTQYGLNYAVGRNCRFLQGPQTDPFSLRRIREAIRTGRDHQDILLNYRRDGSPFMNLLTIAPLLDDQGKVRYFIGAQVDISGLVRDSTNLEAMARLVDEQDSEIKAHIKDKKDEFQNLSEMFNHSELETVRVYGGRMHSEQHESDNASYSTHASNRPRLLIREPSREEDFEPARYSTLVSTPSPDTSPHSSLSLNGGRLPGVFAHYLILRPHPSLRITFTSPSLRVPGLLQSPFLSRIGGSRRVREELALALSEGRNVTAKVRWLLERSSESSDVGLDDYMSSSPSQPGKTRWIHCTPLLGAMRTIGAWMVIMIDSEDNESIKPTQPQRAGIISPSINIRARSTSVSTNKARSMNTRDVPSRQNQQQTKPPPSTNGSEWDLDLDLATTGNFPHPPSRNDSYTTQATTYQDPYRRPSLALPPSPPPTTTIPPIPHHPSILNTKIPRSTSLNAMRAGTSSPQRSQAPPPPNTPVITHTAQTSGISQAVSPNNQSAIHLPSSVPRSPPKTPSNMQASTGNKSHKLAHRMLGNLLKPSTERAGREKVLGQD